MTEMDFVHQLMDDLALVSNFFQNCIVMNICFLFQVIRGFAEIANMPGVVGCIDGTHIRIKRPIEFEKAFVNRKHYHSINVQVNKIEMFIC